jgi:hypothetical protein
VKGTHVQVNLSRIINPLLPPLTSISELRIEIQLPASGIVNFKYPYLFPFLSMPPPTTEPTIAGSTSNRENPSSHLGLEEERSWFYYLAEISLRRTMNRILSIFYGQGEQHWLLRIRQMIGDATICAEAITAWYIFPQNGQ